MSDDNVTEQKGYPKFVDTIEKISEILYKLIGILFFLFMFLAVISSYLGSFGKIIYDNYIVILFSITFTGLLIPEATKRIIQYRLKKINFIHPRIKEGSRWMARKDYHDINCVTVVLNAVYYDYGD